MKILLTGATGYIGKRLLPVLLEQGLLGRLYWYAVLPFHYFVFNGMVDNLKKYQ